MKGITNKIEFRILGSGFSILIIGVLLAIGAMVYKQKRDVYHLAEGKLRVVSDLIQSNIEGAMLTGTPELAKNVLPRYGKFKDIETVAVYNAAGREAFNPDGPLAEAGAMERIARTGAPILVKEKGRFTLFRPLENKSECRGCHPAGAVLGVVKVSTSLAEEDRSIAGFVYLIGGGGLFGMAFLGVVFWLILNRFVIAPVKGLEVQARRMAEGDLNFRAAVGSSDEIGKLSDSIRESLRSLSGILGRVKEISGRIREASDRVEKDSGKVVESTQLEAESISNISSSVEEMNASIAEIAENVEGLAASVEQTAASIEEIAASIWSIAGVANDLSDAVDTTGSSIEELSATLKEVAGGAGELARVSDETLSAMEEIISSIKEVEQKAMESSRLSRKVTDEAATLGVAAVSKTAEGMEKIERSVAKTAEVIDRLGARSEEIGKILNVIDDITEQTTLLALNAAILAAQAGEKGKGFSVVADEIKSLAERTGFSTQEIASLIEAVRAEVKSAGEAMEEGLASVREGMRLAEEAGVSLSRILESARLSSEVSLAIERATGEQARGARHVSESVEKVRMMVEKMARATSEQSKGVALIMAAAEKMKDAALQVKTTTEQQAESSRQISQAIEVISEKSQHISKAINEQKAGSNQIWVSIEKIKDIPAKSRDISFGVNRAVRNLLEDADLMNIEIDRFKLAEGESSGYRFGIVPLESRAEMYRKFAPLAEYLSKKLGRKVELRMAINFESSVEELGKGVTSFCFLTPSTYVQARQKYGARVLVKALREGRPFQHSVIVARQGGPVKTVKDIKGRSFAFGDENSTSSHIVPRAMLLEEGIDLKDLSYYNYLGHHDEVAKAVLKGEFDAGGVMESTALRFREEGLALIKFSAEIPEFNIACRDMDDGAAVALKKALLELNISRPEDAAILTSINKSCTGFMEATDKDYEGIKAMMQKLGMM